MLFFLAHNKKQTFVFNVYYTQTKKTVNTENIKAAYIILQQPGVPLLNLKICHFQNVQLHVIWCKPGSKARMIRPK